jgi:hypothetical protein
LPRHFTVTFAAAGTPEAHVTPTSAKGSTFRGVNSAMTTGA